MNSLKIIWITSSFPSGHDSKNGIFIYRTVKTLSAYYDISVICLFPSVLPLLKMLQRPLHIMEIYKDWQKNFPKNPIIPHGLESSSVYYVRYWRLPKRFFNHFEGYFAYFKVKGLIKKISLRNTIIHSNWIFPSGQLAQIISKKYNLPYTVSLRGIDIHKLQYGTKYWKMAKDVIENAKIVSAVSQGLIIKCSKERITIDKNKVHFISNIYDENTFVIKDKSIMREKLGNSTEKKIILFAGGLIDVKNVDTLILAFSCIVKNNSNCEMFIAGSGEKEHHLKNLVKRLNVADKVSFLGNLNQTELVEYLNAADVFCLPSKNEGTPNVLVESMLCGTPVVASNVGGIPDVISPGVNGFLLEPSSVQDISKKLEDALNINWDRDLIRQSVKRFFTDEVVKKYHALYEELAN